MSLAMRALASAIACTCSLWTFAHAQVPMDPAPPAAQTAPRLDPKACNDRDRLRDGDTVENEGRAPAADEQLSDKLARTDGVICPPPGLDPHIRAPAPGGGTMPVIPPPGSPGGDPNVRPK